MKSILLVGLGGFVGSVARYLVAIASPSNIAGIPLPTLLVNVVGSLAIGALAGFGENRLGSAAWKLFVVGGLGGFTTFSAFALETHTLLRDGSGALAAISIALQVVLSVFAAWVGYALVR